MAGICSRKYPHAIYWYKKGTEILHREDGPAIEQTNGTKLWYQNGLCHRISGPAVEFYDGAKHWYQNGERHRTDGPAIDNNIYDGNKDWDYADQEYWLYGKYYPNIKTDEEWIIFQIIN